MICRACLQTVLPETTLERRRLQLGQELMALGDAVIDRADSEDAILADLDQIRSKLNEVFQCPEPSPNAMPTPSTNFTSRPDTLS